MASDGQDSRSHITAIGGTVHAEGSSHGDHSPVSNHWGRPPETPARSHQAKPETPGTSHQAELGIVTMLAEEAAAARAMLERHGPCEPAGRLPGCHEGRITTPSGNVRVVLTRTLDQGNRSVMAAVGRLRRVYDPEIFAVVGIAGGVHDSLRIGDVVVATQVIYYDLRKETEHGTQPRTRSHPVPAGAIHAINGFFMELGADPGRIVVPAGDGFRGCSVTSGPIGAGEAVVADRGSWIRRLLSAMNDQVLAVEMESGGLAQALYEEDEPAAARDWLVVRGISDLADHRKDDTARVVAAQNAAAVLERLAPHLARRRAVR